MARCACAPGPSGTPSSRTTPGRGAARTARSSGGPSPWWRSAACRARRSRPSSCGSGGPGAPALDTVWRPYIHRFDLEHTLRFAKQTLLWTAPRARHPAQADRRGTLWVVAGRRRLHHAATGQAARARPTAPPGTAPPAAPPHPLPRPPGRFGAPARPRHPRQPATTPRPLAGAPARPPLGPGTAPLAHQEGRLNALAARAMPHAPVPPIGARLPML
jgi:hypothetical protein